MVRASLSVSLDGFYTGLNPGADDPLGSGGEVLHSWFSHEVADRNQLTADEILRPEFERTGSLVMGRDSYEHAQALWGPEPPFRMPILSSPITSVKTMCAGVRSFSSPLTVSRLPLSRQRLQRQVRPGTSSVQTPR